MLPPPGAVDAESAATLLTSLIEIGSVNPAYDPAVAGEGALAAAIGGFCVQLGCAVEYQEILDGRPNVVATLSGSTGGYSLVIEGHSDTVGLPSGSTAPRAIQVGDRIFGRGACDVKGGLVAALLALTELAAARPTHVDVTLVGAIDEEYEFRGVTGYLERLTVPDAAIVLEPTELRVVNRHNGVLRVEILVRGRAGHTSRPAEGRNAIHDAALVVQALHIWHAREFGVTGTSENLLTVTTIEGGSAINVVPDQCLLGVDIRTAPNVDPSDVSVRLEAALARLRTSGIEASIARTLLADGGLATPSDAPLVLAALLAAGQDEPAWAPFGTDASKIARRGVPTVVFGPGSINHAHSDDEWVDLADVLRASKIIVALVRELDRRCVQ